MITALRRGLLVLLAVLAATVVRFSSGSQASLSQDVQAARAPVR